MKPTTKKAAETVNVEGLTEEKPVAEKAAAKKTTTAKKGTSTRKTAAKTTKRTTARKKAEVTLNQEVYIQFWGKEVYAKDVVDRIKGIWADEMGKKPEELLDLKVYIKPEENGAHYVINGDITGFIGL